jgi:ABC-type multidrug transport system ATPase subunit
MYFLLGGAGKTTLLNALSNRAPYAKLTGEVTFGQREFNPQDLMYVPQFDDFNHNMTVYETLQFIGEMKCANKDEMFHRLGVLMKILGLADKAHAFCKELTSGELKRVSVGMGMISNPNVLFLDEPTTGLDSSAAYSIVKYISEVAHSTNVVVIMTIHQPAQLVFEMLQDLYLLERGYLAYFGPSNCTQFYFKTLSFECPEGVNPVDFYLDLVNESNSQKDKNKNDHHTVAWNSLYTDSELAKNVSTMVNHAVVSSSRAGPPTEPPSYTSRFCCMVRFFVRYYSRDIGFYYLRVFYLIIVALFAGTLFLQLRNTTQSLNQYSGALFFCIWTVLFAAVAATGLLASDRRQTMEQVKNAVVLPSIYCLAQFVVSTPFNFVACLIYQSVFHWLTNINPHGEAFIYAVFITCGHLLLMEAIMLTVVAVLKNAMLSVTFAMVVIGYLFLFSGFFILVPNMPPWISWISYITPTMVSTFNLHFLFKCFFFFKYFLFCLLLVFVSWLSLADLFQSEVLLEWLCGDWKASTGRDF